MGMRNVNAGLDELWQPLNVGSFTIENRVMVSAHDLYLDRERYAAYLATRARGGAGLLVTGSLPIVPSALRRDESDATGGRPHCWKPDSVTWFRTISKSVHTHGSKVIAQLMHPGSLAPGNGSLNNWNAAWSSSEVPHPLMGFQPKAMDHRDIAQLIDGFAKSARYAREGGMDGVEVHGAHGYLLHQFLSPLFNKRTDAYGGSPENRARLIVEIGQAIRREVGADFTLGLKLSPQEHVGDIGLTAKTSAELVRVFRDAGAFDYFSVSGVYHTLPKLTVSMTAEEPPGTYRPEARMIKDEVGAEIPVMVTGAVRTLDAAADIIRSGDADIVGMVRAHLADPDLVRKTRSGRGAEVRRCVGANQGCWRRVTVGSVVSCTVNPASGREIDGWDSESAPRLSRELTVVIVGGGPAGMQAAETAAQRGCRVVLIERDEALGGTLRYAARLPRRQRWNDLVEDLSRSVGKLGVEVRLGTEATPELVEGLHPDKIVMATGARWDKTGRSAFGLARNAPAGIESADLRSPLEAIDDPNSLGERVLVIDDTGKYLPLGLADLVSATGREVHVVSSLASPGAQTGGTGTNDFVFVYPTLVERGVKFWNQMYLERIEGKAVTLAAPFGSPGATIPIDTILAPMLRSPETSLFDALSRRGSAVERIGDCLTPREVDDAILEGKRLALAWDA